MAKKKSDDASEPTSEAAADATETISKIEGVRRAVAAGLKDNEEIVQFLKAKFNLDINVPTVSSYKSTVIKANGTKGAKKSGRKSSAKAEPLASNGKPSSPTSHDSMGGSPAALLRTVKELADKHGGDEIREILSLLGK